MSIHQSNLSAYGFDIVVATTQSSINAVIKEFLFKSQLPIVRKYYIKGSGNKPEEIDYERLMKETSGTDPLEFKDTNTTPPEKEKINNLAKAKFLCGFEAEIGLPHHVDPGNVPSVIELNNTRPGFVRFRLLCDRFTVAQAKYDGEIINDFLCQSQSLKPLWTFTAEVPLKLVNRATNVPDMVKKLASALGEDFSVQKLILDLDNAVKGEVPEISGVAKGSPVYNALDDVFVKIYFNNLKNAGEPVLNYAVMLNMSDPSSLKLTGADKGINRFVDDSGQVVNDTANDHTDLYTLNYFCVTNGHSLPTPTQLPWNWLDNTPADRSFHGAIAIRRGTIIDYFHSQMYDQVSNICLVPKPIVTTGGGGLNYSLDFSTDKPEVVFNSAGNTVMVYSYQREVIDYAGAGGSLGNVITKTSLNVSVDFKDKAVIITQNLLIHFSLRHWFWTGSDSIGLDIIDVANTDTYTLDVDDTGNLTMKCSTSQVDRFNKDAKCLQTSYRDDLYDLKTKIETMLSGQFKSIQLSLMKNFIFPAGETFLFNNVCFSEHQDLVANITYIKPR